MALVVRLARNDVTDAVDFGIGEILLLGHRKHTLALGVAQKLTLVVEQLQGVPLARVVRRGDDDATVGLVRRDGQLRSGRGAEPDVHHVDAAAEQRSLDQIGHHFTRYAGVAADDDGQLPTGVALGNQTGVGRRELHHVERREVVARMSSDGSPNAGDGFNQSHDSLRVY